MRRAAPRAASGPAERRPDGPTPPPSPSHGTILYQYSCTGVDKVVSLGLSFSSRISRSSYLQYASFLGVCRPSRLHKVYDPTQYCTVLARTDLVRRPHALPLPLVVEALRLIESGVEHPEPAPTRPEA